MYGFVRGAISDGRPYRDNQGAAGQLTINLHYTCAVKGASPPRVKVPPGNWFAPPGSNRSGGGGNEAVGASGVEGRLGDLASMQAVT